MIQRFEILNFTKIRPLGTLYFRAVRRTNEGTDEQTDITMIIFVGNFAKTLTKEILP